jgi:hypothetical protein
MDYTDLPHCIIDGHSHIASTEYIPYSFIDGVVENIYTSLIADGIRASRNKIKDMYLEGMQDPLCEQLLVEMRNAGINRTVLLLPDFTFALPDAELSIAEMFEKHHQVLERHAEKFFVFAGVDPRWGKDGIDLFERGVNEFGFHGLKLYPPCGYRVSDPGLYPLYEICREQKLPVLLHVGETSPVLSFDTTNPMFLDQVARDFPDVNFILAHGSVAYVEECIMLCKGRPNVYLDVSAFQSEATSALARVFGRGLNHKVIFGTDWPVFRQQGSQRKHIERLLGESELLDDLRTRELEGFFGGTILKLMGREDVSKISLGQEGGRKVYV